MGKVIPDLRGFVANMPRTFTTTLTVWNGQDWVNKDYTFKLYIDVDKIKSQVNQASRNKSKKSVGGPVEVVL